MLVTESAAISALAGALDENFDRAVEQILAAEGRVVVSGMGKSGHIGRKIAATFASTGSPAQFVHPAEASHGDLGMVTEKDVALVLSNSGETPELFHLVEHTRRFGIPLIGMASRAESTLMRQSDIALLLPAQPEACPMGLAPTTSTTMSLALGDALAVAVMSRRDFTPANFRTFHPGGKLGARLLNVSGLMHAGDALPLIRENSPMSEAILEMSAKSFGVVGVLDADGALIGVVSDGDLRRAMDGLMTKTAGEVATRHPKTISADALAAEALAVMNGHKITSLFVVEGAAAESGDTEASEPRAKAPVGLIHIHDCLRAGIA
ncbi:MAG: KpsF/GutQ family sugar-phosphate isomerase [Neomegalonema sp.]|nr:KpsF/GutQ family sugar-phosphate isomerase [Neomegalonema sp.]